MNCPHCGKDMDTIVLSGTDMLQILDGAENRAPVHLDPFEGAPQHDEPNVTDGDLLAGP